jgi:hypothetical protein
VDFFPTYTNIGPLLIFPGRYSFVMAGLQHLWADIGISASFTPVWADMGSLGPVRRSPPPASRPNSGQPAPGRLSLGRPGLLPRAPGRSRPPSGWAFPGRPRPGWADLAARAPVSFSAPAGPASHQTPAGPACPRVGFLQRPGLPRLGFDQASTGAPLPGLFSSTPGLAGSGGSGLAGIHLPGFFVVPG